MRYQDHEKDSVEAGSSCRHVKKRVLAAFRAIAVSAVFAAVVGLAVGCSGSAGGSADGQSDGGGAASGSGSGEPLYVLEHATMSYEAAYDDDFNGDVAGESTLDWEVDENGNISRKSVTWSSTEHSPHYGLDTDTGTMVAEYVLDANGFPVSRITRVHDSYSDSESKMDFENEFNDQGLLVKQTILPESGGKSVREFEYYPDGSLNAMTKYLGYSKDVRFVPDDDAAPSDGGTIRDEYTEEGLPLRDAFGDLEWGYDSDGNLVSLAFTGGDSGRVVAELGTDEAGNIVSLDYVEQYLGNETAFHFEFSYKKVENPSPAARSLHVQWDSERGFPNVIGNFDAPALY